NANETDGGISMHSSRFFRSMILGAVLLLPVSALKAQWSLFAVQKYANGYSSAASYYVPWEPGYSHYFTNGYTNFPAAGGSWSYQYLDWDRDGNYDLVGFQRSAPSGFTEVHILGFDTGQHAFTRHVLDSTTAI